LNLVIKIYKKRGVIIDSEVPSIARGKTKFLIKPTGPGAYEVKATIAGTSATTIELRIDDLLERQFNNVDRLDLDQVTLDVNMTIVMLNEKFQARKR